MSVVALAETHTFWTVAVGLGAVVIAVVILLMMLLLSFLKDIEESCAQLIETGSEVAENTAAIARLRDTGSVLDMIRSEALVHDGWLRERV